MIRELIKLLIVLAVMDCLYNAIWVAAAHTPTLNLFTSLGAAAVLALLLSASERAAERMQVAA